MDRTGQSLLSKWSIKDPGKKSSLESTKSSLLTNRSSLLSTGLETKLTMSGGELERKRKQLVPPKPSDQNKKLLVEKKAAPLKSSLLGASPLLTQSNLKSSLLSTSSLNSQLMTSTLQKSLTPTPQTQSLSSGGLSHGMVQTRPLTASLLGSTKSSISLLNKYSSSGISSNLSPNKSLLGQTSTSVPQKTSGLSTSSVLTPQPSRLVGVSIQTSQPLSTSHLTSKLCSTNVKEKKAPGKSKKSKKRAAEEKSDFEKYKVKAPRYDLGQVLPEDEGVEVPKFVNPSKDPSLHKAAIPLHDVNGLKLALINAVSGSLICQPNFSDSKDLTRRTLAEMSDRVVTYDPEFILKVALYTRKGLNIRTTANFLLALASNIDACRPFLKKYYCALIQLPSDWIEVAEIYQAFHDTNLSHGSLPAALRKVMILKFPEFDKYQLAKYNKESSMKKKKKKENKENANRGTGMRGRGRGARGGIRGARGGTRGAIRGRGGPGHPTNQRDLFSSDSDSDEEDGSPNRLTDVVYDEEEHTKEEMEKIKFSIKQLIRKLHIVEPVEHVMSIIGKKYPDNLEDFYKARLPGEWDQDRAGKRMKLPVPETWETQVSLKGNKASTWEDLIDHKKLPFMAMLRNLRNLIKAGISQKHHQQILRRLQDERQVANSKQFPFRFFSAYEVLSGLEKEYEDTQKKLVEAAEMEAAGTFQSSHASRGGGGRGRGRGRGRGKGKGQNWWMDKKNKKKDEMGKPKETAYDKAIINRYKKALDTAVKIATVYNVQPIRGRTIVLCDCSDQMRVNCTAAKGLGKPRQMLEVGLLMGLMCKYSCEECEFITFQENSWKAATVEPGTILNALERLLNEQDNIKSCTSFNGLYGEEEISNGFPESVLTEKLRDQIQVDNIVVLSGGELAQTQQRLLSNFLKKYRQIVNPNLLYVNISFAGKGCGFSQSIKPEHDNDIYISGYSDAILRFIAERGEGGQLIHVEKIDEAFKLKALAGAATEGVGKVSSSTPERLLPLLSGKPSWRKTRVFISSTFRDMHGERDVLTRYVFPELRAQGRKHFINIQEVDLRWGITEEESNRAVELCLTEVMKCEFFIGILGSRYGYVPDTYLVPDMEEFDWLKTYPPNASVTELEMHLGALANPAKAVDKAFFYVRDTSFESVLPSEFHSDFLTENPQAKARLEALKNRIYSSSIEVYKGYPCQWGGVSEGRPMVTGLEKFATRVLNNLWNAVQKAYPEEEAILDENMHVAKQHEAVVESYKERFVGRKNLIKECMKHITDKQTSLICLNGKPGCGKSALLSALVHSYMENPCSEGSRSALVHVVGAAPGSANIVATLRRLCYELRRMFCVETEIPEDFKNLTQKFGELLEEGASMSASRLVIFIDGLDMMEKSHQPYNLEWLPREIPKNVVFVMTTMDGGKCHSSLKRRAVTEVTVGGLDMFDKAEVVRNNLAVYRKKLDESPFTNQMKFIMGKRDAGNPLFLKLACEELRVFGKFEMVTSKLKSLPQTVSQMLQEVLGRLESDLGQELIALAMSLLVCSRDGLMPEELHDLLSLHALMNKTKVTAENVCNVLLSPDKMLPPAVFSHLRRSLHTFLNPNENPGTCLSLAHMDVAVAVRSRYMKGSGDQETNLHRLMAGYFLQLVDPERDQSYTGNSVRAFSELPYHLAFGGEFKMLARVVCSLEFISTKCRLGLGNALLEDYQEKEFNNKSMEREQQRIMGQPRFQEYKMFVSRNIHLLDKYPALTWQQAVNDLHSSEPYNDGVASLDTARNQCDLCFRWSNRPQTQDPNYLTLSNLPQPVLCVAVSPDSEYFACGGMDCVVHLHQMETGKEVRSFCGHADVISDVCFAGKMYVCSASLDNLISVWNREDGHRVHTLKGHSRRVQSIASDPSGKLVASASWDCTVKVWNLAKGECVCDLKIASPVNAVSFHPEGQLIVTGQWDSTITIWDVFHKTRKAVLRGHSSSIRDVAYSPCGRYIASAALDGDVKLWESQKGSQVGNVLGHSLPINKLVFSPTGRNLITVSDDQKIKVWSGHLGKPLHCLGNEEEGQVKCVALSPDGETLAVGYHEGEIKFYEVQTGSLIHSSTPHIAAVRRMNFSPCGNFLVTASADCNAKVFRVPTGVLVATMTSVSPLMCVTMTKTYIAMGTEDNQCLLFPSVNLKTRVGIQMNAPQATLRGQNGPVTSCTFNSDASRLATASRDASVYIWDVRQCLLDGKNSQPAQKLHACHADWITDCQWSNMGDYLVTGSVDFNLKIWDIKSGEEKFKLTGHMASITSVRYSYGCIVSSSSDGSVKVWSQKGTEITTLHGHTQCANDTALLVRVSKESVVDEEEDNSDWAAEPKETKPVKKRPKVDMESVLVASCSDDGTIRLWNPLQANQLANLTGHDDKVISVASDSHGNLCTSSLDKSVRLWKPTLSSEADNVGHDAQVTFVCVSKDGRCLLTGSRDGYIKLWTVNTDRTNMDLVQSLKGHGKSVNAGCFVGHQYQKFVTGGDDAKVVEWKCVQVKDDSSVTRFRRQSSYELDSPVTSVLWHDAAKVSSLHVIVCAEWEQARVSVISTASQTVLQSVQLGSPESGLWVMNLLLLQNTELLALTSDSVAHILQISGSLLSKGNCNIKVIKKHEIPCMADITEKVPEHKRGLNMVLCGAMLPENVLLSDAVTQLCLLGDSKGQLTVLSQNSPIASLKIHDRNVTSVKVTGDIILTASLDRSVKAWRIDTTRSYATPQQVLTEGMEQVGQFWCPAPVTSMEIVADSSGRGLVCGDQLGNVHFFVVQELH